MPLCENIVLHLFVGQSVCDDGWSIFRPNDVRSISFYLSARNVRSISFYQSISQYLSARKLPNLVQWMLLDNTCQVTWSKVKVKLQVFVQMLLAQIFWNVCLKVAKLGTVRINDHPLLMLRSYGQRSRWNCWS